MKRESKDSLTGALSRATFDDRFPVEFQRALDSEAPLSLLIIDLDHFKSVNDAFGHPRGDEVLVEFVQRALTLVRISDALFRYGGDEFALLLPNTAKEDATLLAHRLYDAIQASSFPGDPPLSLSLSIGLAAASEADSHTALFEKADLRLLEAKRRGRAQIIARDVPDTSLTALYDSSRLVERESEVEAIYRFLADLRDAKRGLFEINGPQGAGKSRFLAEVTKAARLQGFYIISIRTSPATRVRAFAALTQAADDDNDLPASPSQVRPFTLGLPGRLADNGAAGLVIAVDDIANLDQSTAAWLHDLLANSLLPPTALAFSSDPRHFHAGLPLDAPLRQKVELFPLSFEGMRIWLRKLLQWEPSDDFLAWLYQQTEGYPARLHKGLVYLVDQGILHETPDGWTIAQPCHDLPLAVWLNAQSAPPPNNLPTLSTFVGRDDEIRQAKSLLANHRLLTFLGPGGIGKTHLAIQSAAESLDAFPDGAFLVQLASLPSPDFLVSTIAEALMFFFFGQEDPKRQLLNYLREKEILLLLDNFEHLLDGTPFIADLLHAALGLKLIVTSRERVNLREEKILELGGLPYPRDPITSDPRGYSAVQLFLQSARKDHWGEGLPEEDDPHIVRICQLVEGMPLGIELAAAWVKMLPPREIAEQIEHNLDFLATQHPDTPERHRSLRAVFDHFWGYLSEPERSVLRRLSAFRGGFRLDAAQQIAGASFFFLSALVDKSFLRRDASGRYEMHEVLHQYAEEKLGEAHDELQSAHDRHCEFFAHFLNEREPLLLSKDQRKALEEIGQEIENLRTAWRWAVEQDNLSAMSDSLESLFHFYEVRNWLQIGEAELEHAANHLRSREIESSALRALLLGRVLAWQGRFAMMASHHKKAEGVLQESLTSLDAERDPQKKAFALNTLGDLKRILGDYETAKRLQREALELYRRIEDRHGIARTLNIQGVIAGTTGALEEAKRLFQESLAACRQVGNRWGEANVINNLGMVAHLRGESEEAEQRYQETLVIYQDLGDRVGVANAYVNLGLAAYDLGDYEEAEDLCRQSLRIYGEVGDPTGVATSSAILGRAALALQDFREARVRLYQALKTALEIEAISLALEISPGIAELLLRDGEKELAQQLVLHTLQHPACDQGTHNRAERLLEELQLPTEASDSSEEGGDPTAFWALLEAILRCQGADAATAGLRNSGRSRSEGEPRRLSPVIPSPNEPSPPG